MRLTADYKHKKTSELENMSMRIIQTEAYREKDWGGGWRMEPNKASVISETISSTLTFM